MTDEELRDNYDALLKEYRQCARDNARLRNNIEDLQHQLEKSMMLCEEWSETNRKWQDLCRRMMEQR